MEGIAASMLNESLAAVNLNGPQPLSHVAAAAAKNDALHRFRRLR